MEGRRFYDIWLVLLYFLAITCGSEESEKSYDKGKDISTVIFMNAARMSFGGPEANFVVKLAEVHVHLK